MARVTVEDCLEHIPNQFELAMVAAKRSRQLVRGAEARIPWGTHKSTVVALREIAENKVSKDILTEDDLPLASLQQVPLPPIDLGTDL